MYKKLNLKTLVVILVILIIAAMAVYLSDSKRGERSFRAQMVDADTSKVTRIVIYPKAERDDVIELMKEPDGWKVISGTNDYHADQGMVKNILTTLAELKPLRLAATEKPRWHEFDVTDSAATRVKLYTGKKLATHLYVGRFSYQPPKNQNPYNYGQQGTMSTFVRLADEKSVYAVEGFLAMSFGRGLSDFRNKVITRFNREDLSKLSFTYPADSSFALIREGNRWTVDGLICDSASAATYINTLSMLSSSNFIDDQEPLKEKSDFILSIEGNNFVTPIVVKAFESDTTIGYLISSSLNKGAYFSGTDNDLANKIFVSKNRFFKQEETKE
ncbi:MAG: DUF4340 domain-containing protein [Bacteroidales bacterium]|nr:DUF4340 domain-containing protein [Bacteroidales bacterium]